VVRRVPPAQRLLLLALPAPRSGEPVSATVALARTESQLTQEAEALTPYLADLQAQGLIDNYQLIPAAGAVWVSGTATATQLEGLPGVASLAGVQPRDLVAAQAGLAHSILIQVGPQQAPSLWPVGFRSALHAWRPIAAVSNGHALVTGFTLPGERVLVSLQRRGTLIGAAGALADPENGGFVVMIHDKAGNPVTTRPGDIVQVSSSGRAAQVRVMTLAVKAREHRVTGTAQPGSTVLLALISTSGEAVQRQVATADASGSFAMRVRGMLPAGTLAVASGVDFAGDQESATAFVPGVHVVEGGTTVQGWTVGDAPYLQIRRDGKLLLQRNLHPAPDGSFQIDLQRGGRPLVLDAGDVLSLGSRWHRRYFTVPSLRVALGFGANHIRIFGAARARVHVAIERVGSEDRGREVRLDAHGVGQVTWPGGPAEVGDGASAEIVASGGNTVEATADVGGIVLHEGEARVTGRVRPGSTLSIHLSTGSGKMLAGAVASGSATTGNFAATLKDMSGRTVSIRSGLRVDVRDGSRTETTAVLPIDLAISRGDYAILGETAPARAVWLTIVDRQGHQQIRRLETSSTGRISVHLSQSTLLSPPAGVSLSTALADGITIERSLAGKEMNHRSVRQSATRRSALPRSKQHARHSPG
jgi:hypothetical protein